MTSTSLNRQPGIEVVQYITFILLIVNNVAFTLSSAIWEARRKKLMDSLPNIPLVTDWTHFLKQDPESPTSDTHSLKRRRSMVSLTVHEPEPSTTTAK